VTKYLGSELEIFANASNWKVYLRSQVSMHLGRRVLEVGAGTGSTTKLMCGKNTERWVCLEPDVEFAARLAEKVHSGELPPCCEVVAGTLAAIPADRRFDTILYSDVLEHICDDTEEVRRAAEHLEPGGSLIVVSPAYQWLYTPFDRAIGHYRRYTKRMLAALQPAGVDLIRLAYLDTVGLLASLANRLLLKSSMPTPGQIWAWDKIMVPVSRCADRVVAYRMGKTVLAVWRRPSC
jgi:phospholipid N-methyltransferase